MLKIEIQKKSRSVYMQQDGTMALSCLLKCLYFQFGRFHCTLDCIRDCICVLVHALW